MRAFASPQSDSSTRRRKQTGHRSHPQRAQTHSPQDFPRRYFVVYPGCVLVSWPTGSLSRFSHPRPADATSPRRLAPEAFPTQQQVEAHNPRGVGRGWRGRNKWRVRRRTKRVTDARGCSGAPNMGIEQIDQTEMSTRNYLAYFNLMNAAVYHPNVLRHMAGEAKETSASLRASHKPLPPQPVTHCAKNANHAATFRGM